MPYLPGLLYSSIPFPVRVIRKKAAEGCKRLLLIIRGVKLVRRLVRKVLSFLIITLTTLLALLRVRRAFSLVY